MSIRVAKIVNRMMPQTLKSPDKIVYSTQTCSIGEAKMHCMLLKKDMVRCINAWYD
jgi:hypothetical protein